MKLPVIALLVGLIALTCCAPRIEIYPDGTEVVAAPGSNDTTLDDSSEDSTQAPSIATSTQTPPITNQNVLRKSNGKVAHSLYGFDKLKFGMSIAQAFSSDPTLELATENSFTFLGTISVIDGISFDERVFFSGTPAKMDYVTLQCLSTEDATQEIVTDLTAKYGEPKISESSLVPGDDSYEWYFLNGATISVSEGIVYYDSPQIPVPARSF